jgi:hypothetical protein
MALAPAASKSSAGRRKRDPATNLHITLSIASSVYKFIAMHNKTVTTIVSLRIRNSITPISASTLSILARGITPLNISNVTSSVQWSDRSKIGKQAISRRV